jgi:hypothetical protein
VTVAGKNESECLQKPEDTNGEDTLGNWRSEKFVVFALFEFVEREGICGRFGRIGVDASISAY